MYTYPATIGFRNLLFRKGMFMKNVNAITNRVTLVFLMAIMIIGNIVLSPHIAL